MKRKILVTYIMSLVMISVTSVSLDRAFVTADTSWVLLATLAGILLLISIMLTFSEWKK